VATSQQSNADQIAAALKFLILRGAEVFTTRCGSAIADPRRRRGPIAAGAK